MIHVNVRGLLVREVEGEKQLIIQLRKKNGEPEVYELPGGRINEYERIIDGLKREILEETGLKIKAICGEEKAVEAAGVSFKAECIKPFSAYQTLEGPVDSFGIHFVCEVEGESLASGDATEDIHWASKEELQKLIDSHKFLGVDMPAVMMLLRDEYWCSCKMSQLIESKFFNVVYDEKDTNVIEQILSVIDCTYESIINTFKLEESSDKFTLYICPDVQSFKGLAGKSDDEYQEWMVGNTDYEEKKLCLLSPNVVRDRTFEDMIKVCKHEVIHIALDQLGDSDDAGILISEGAAVALAEQINIPNLSLEDYPLANKLSDEDYFYKNNGYLYSGVYVLYIIKKYGIDAYKRIYMKEEALDKYLYEGFEKDAIQSLLLECNILK